MVQVLALARNPSRAEDSEGVGILSSERRRRKEAKSKIAPVSGLRKSGLRRKPPAISSFNPRDGGERFWP
jgi:hypothetical protein